ncbi:MAG: hypothetical protein A2015_10185 [Spirochaetes bacterium GWF1_31_7]|nr:MAG: hypothetical protein A2Y30_05820 [Spirochaetes bacterium GWE1_32_154]OHD49505.1 MAG: hypothetical protein A2Y29_01880 [Spirochaetes bacterium GWE2_31_10]OHD49698.1 MAG: hypothetical protein A2015_10185 [Spirochaetes bacterium GWF1_31_7]OHD83291.1 MAG: hypothetical protein A2355_01460 [Spirochaetes bacterium RIFOXYB1_FULL_32_8]HBD96247.1 hypothetical protein [Spirochaetia bacterium]
MKYKKISVIYNKNASGGKAEIKFNQLKNIITQKVPDAEIEYYNSESIKDMENYIVDLCYNKKADLLIPLGGDGTISSISNVLMTIDFDKRIPILPIPGGTGNSFLVDQNITTIDDAFEKFDPNGYFLSDIIEVKTNKRHFYCINIVGMGFISDVAEFAVKHKKSIGALSYILAVFTGLGKFKPYKTKITFSDHEQFNSDKVFFLTISNNKFTAAKFMVAPDADITDGLGDIIILHDINRFQFLKGFSKIFTGKHTHEKGCTYIKSSSLKIEADPLFYIMPDGDLLDDYSPVEINILKAQIKFALKS